MLDCGNTYGKPKSTSVTCCFGGVFYQGVFLLKLGSQTVSLLPTGSAFFVMLIPLKQKCMFYLNVPLPIPSGPCSSFFTGSSLADWFGFSYNVVDPGLCDNSSPLLLASLLSESVCNAGNEKLHNSTEPLASDILQSCSRAFVNCNQVLQPSAFQPQSLTSWNPPPLGWLRINVASLVVGNSFFCNSGRCRR